MLNSLIITVALLAQSKAPALPKGTEVDYNDYADVTMVNLDLVHFTNDAGNHLLAIYVAHKGRDPQAAKEVVLHIYRWGPHWVYRESHDVQLRCGDDKLKLCKVDYLAEEGPKEQDEPCNEYVDIRAPAQDLEKMLERDRDLEVNIGGRKSYTLHAPTRNKILKFVKAVRSGAY